MKIIWLKNFLNISIRVTTEINTKFTCYVFNLYIKK